MAKQPKTYGGHRKGAGRKALTPELSTKPRSLRLTDERWEKLKRLGGAHWLASKIDDAKEPQSVE